MSRLTSDAGNEVRAVTLSVPVGADAQTSFAARITQLAGIVVSRSDSDAADRPHPAANARAVAVDDVAQRALEAGGEHGRRHRQTRQTAHERGRYSADEHVAVVAASEVERVPEDHASVFDVVDHQNGLGAPPAHLDAVPPSVVDIPTQRQIHVSVHLIHKFTRKILQTIQNTKKSYKATQL